MEIMSLKSLIARITIMEKRIFIWKNAVIASGILLFGCGSTDAPSSRPIINQPIETVEPELSNPVTTPEQYIQQAQIEWQRSGDLVARNTLLLTAADSFSLPQECNKALTIVSHLYPQISSAANKAHANLITAECTSTEQIDQAKRAELVSIPAATPLLRDRQKQIQARLLAEQQQWLAAAQTLAQLSQIEAQQTNQIWEWIQRVDYRTQQTSMNRYPNLRQWLVVSAMLHRYGTSPQQLTASFNQFSADFPNHPLVVHTPVEVYAGMSVQFTQPVRIAVVLPLTGRLEVQGNAIKQGVLSAYFNASDKDSTDTGARQTIQFYDSNALTMDQIAEQLQQAELVIGPLLKANIEALTPKLPASAVLVALNRIEQDMVESEPMILQQETTIEQQNTEPSDLGPLPQQRFYFALAPEDEAQQMAQYIYQKGYRSPILVHPQDAIGERLAKAFLTQWRALNRRQSSDGISVVSYTDNDAMRDGILEALDVAQSKNRIKLLEQQLIPELYNVPRNRRDVDAIIAFATPEQTELLNPIVESSLSPFNDKTVPVYVTSRSISLDITKNQLRDLQNVYFLDLPWMMPEHSWRDLSEQVNLLYPNQRDSTKRLFALGYDAFAQISALPHLAAIPQLSTPALSGELSVNQYQQVIRQLPIAVIDNEKVKVLVEP